MRVLLINSNRLKQPWPVIPFGLLCVAKSVEKAGHLVNFLDLCFLVNPQKAISQTIEKFKPDVVGISIRNIDNSAGYRTVFLLEEVKSEVIRPLKKAFKGPILMGGSAVGINAEEMLEFFDLEYAVAGDGEVVMVDFLTCLEQKISTEGMKGLIIRKNGVFIHPPALSWVKDLDTLSFPEPYKYLDLRAYRKFDSPLQIQTKRGCSLRCIYCTYNRIEGHSYRLRNPALVADEIETLTKKTGINHIEFTDSTFNIPLEHAKSVLRAVKQKNLKLRLNTMGLTPLGIDEELVTLMKEAGFTEVWLGAESGCDATLKSLGKNYTTSDVIKAGKLLHEKGISITYALLLGAPNETPETVAETITTIAKTADKWDLIDIGIGIRAYKGAPISDQIIKTDPKCTNDSFLHPVKFEPEGLKLDSIKIIAKRASFIYPNIYMYDEDENTPPIMFALAVGLFALLHLKKPVWKLFILLRKLETLSGIRKIRQCLWERKLKREKWKAIIK